MKPSLAFTLLAEARADGFTLSIKPNGTTIKVCAPRGKLDYCLPVLRDHKPALLVLLAAMPSLGG